MPEAPAHGSEEEVVSLPHDHGGISRLAEAPLDLLAGGNLILVAIGQIKRIAECMGHGHPFQLAGSKLSIP